MVYSKEFFNQRSFEVVWAVFRVAEYSARGKMKEALETKALDYLIAKNIYSLADLEGVVTLAINVGDVSKTNGGVILREINNLKGAIEELRIREERLAIPAKSPEKAPNIEEVFSKPPMLFKEFIETVESLKLKVESGEKERKSNEKGVMSNEKATVTADKSQEIREKQVNELVSTTKWQESGNKVAIKWQRGDLALNDRQNKLMEILSQKTIVKIGNLSGFFDGVSKRTLRYDIQRLVENGVIEKLGGGPSSFLRIKRSKNIKREV